MSRLGEPWDPANLRSSFTRSKALLSLGPAQLCPGDKGRGEMLHLLPLALALCIPDSVFAEVGRGVFLCSSPKTARERVCQQHLHLLPSARFFFEGAGGMVVLTGYILSPLPVS